MSSIQFGFRNSVDTSEAIFRLHVLIQRARDVNHNVYACFIDYQKAFDKVEHDKLIKILKVTGIDDQDLSILSNLYWNQTSAIRVEAEMSSDIPIKRGVREGFILSPLLFDLYSEFILREALNKVNEDIKVNGECINNIRYTDDTVVFANNMSSLQKIVNRIVDISKSWFVS